MSFLIFLFVFLNEKRWKMLYFSEKIGIKESRDWWTERDLNPRLPRCERGDHTADLPAHNSQNPLFNF